MKNLIILIMLCGLSILSAEIIPVLPGGEWCEINLLDQPAAGKPLRFILKYRGVTGKLSLHAHGKNSDGASAGFLAGQNSKPYDSTGNGTVNGTITVPAKPGITGFFLIAFISPDGSFGKKSEEARTEPLLFGSDSTPANPASANVSKTSSAQSAEMESGKNWCGVELSGDAVPGKPLTCTVHYKNVNGLLGMHAHWNDKTGKYRGFLAGASQKPVPVSGSGNTGLDIVLPNQPELGSYFLILFVTPDGNFASKSKEARTAALYPAGIKPPDIKSPALPLYDIEKSKIDGRWSWQEPAQYTSAGDLVYQARPFVFRKGINPRYIDYSGGSDQNDGKSPQTAWQHHPDDPAAADTLKKAPRGDTYVFKRGVIYRGEILVSQSGTENAPVIFTADPAWGKGEALLAGSERVQTPWKPAASLIPYALSGKEKIWYTEIGTNAAPHSVWVITGGRIAAVPIARFPNWRFSNPDDFRSEWGMWEGIKTEKIEQNGAEQTLTIGYDRRAAGLNRELLIGATIWSEHFHLINAPLPSRLQNINTDGSLQFIFPHFRKGPVTNCRYYIENKLALLDSAGEHYYDPDSGRLYIRLPDDTDPNNAVIETAIRQNTMTIADQSHIRISGLSFRFNNSGDDFLAQWMNGYNEPGCVRLFNNCRDIEIANCNFSQACQGVLAVTKRPGSLLDQLVIRDNTASEMEIGFADISDGYTSYRTDHLSVVLRVQIMRNNLHNTGFGLRPMNNLASAIVVSHARLLEIAGNHIENCGGVGINVYAGKGGNIAEDPRDLPLVRTIVHHNRVINPLIIINDYGGIESWMCGPNYMFDNISGNPGGYKHFFHTTQTNEGDRSYKTARFGFAYYLDGPFKNFLFNNVAWGKNNDVYSPLCNTAALMDLLGYGHSFFNNSFYNFACAIRVQEPDAGRDQYLGNIFENISSLFIDFDGWLNGGPRDLKKDPVDYPTMAMARNIISGQHTGIDVLDFGSAPNSNFSVFQKRLAERHMRDASIGTEAAASQFKNAELHDFHLQSSAAARDTGARVFVPWGLVRTVGEWNFYQPAADEPIQVTGESMYFSDEYRHRLMYRQTIKNDLQCVNTVRADFIPGTLDNWIPGVLSFNGKNWCAVSDKEMKKDMHYRYEKGGKANEFDYAGKDRKTLDMDTNNFLFEMVLQVPVSYRGGTVLAKTAGTGYELMIQQDGTAAVSLAAKSGTCKISSKIPLNDGKWHHLLAEIDRSTRSAVIYIDGRAVPSAVSGAFPAVTESLANTGDFLVGRNSAGNFFQGALDYLRVSRGTLAEAYTCIEELYDWEFRGPQYADFTGLVPVDGKRDAGAFEFSGR